MFNNKLDRSMFLTEFGKWFMNELNELPLILQAPNSSTRNYIDQIAASRKTVLSATYELVSYGLPFKM